jgi:hypothetical protein
MEDIELVPNGTLTLPQIFSPLPMYAAWPCCFAYRVYAGSCRESSFSQDVNAINYREEEIVGCILLPGPVPRPYTVGLRTIYAEIVPRRAAAATLLHCKGSGKLIGRSREFLEPYIL